MEVDSWNVVKQSQAEHDVRSIACSPDGRLLACGGSDGVVAIVDVESGRDIRTLRAHQGTVNAVEWHPSEPRIATAGADGRVKLWSLEDLEQPRTIETPGPIQKLSWKDERTIAAVQRHGGNTLCWDASSLAQVSASLTKLTALACPSPDGRWIAEERQSAEQPTRKVVVYDRELGSDFLAETGFKDVTHLNWSPDSRLVAIGGDLRTVPAPDSSTASSSKTRYDHEVTTPAGVEFWNVAEQQKPLAMEQSDAFW